MQDLTFVFSKDSDQVSLILVFVDYCEGNILAWLPIKRMGEVFGAYRNFPD